jgi:mono/diheme cytochrome c family protein
MKSWPELLAAAAVLTAATAARAEVTFYQARIAPIMERHCTVCHGAEKQKGGLRVDTLEFILKGAKLGKVIEAGNAKESELFRRITLPRDHEDVMPSDGKPLLSADEIRNIELWIAGGVSATKVLADFPDAPALRRAPVATVALAPDWRPRAAEIAELEKSLGVRLVARSLVATDGLILRTASAPGRCDDATLARLAPVAPLIVEAELARTKVTDAGLSALVACSNLRMLDLTRTAVTSRGLEAVARLKQLETLNLTDTAVDDAGVAQLKALPALRKVWLFGTKTTAGEVTVGMVSP